MSVLFYKLAKNTADCFRRYFFWHLLAIILTYILVSSGFDWLYFESTRSGIISTFLFPAVMLGSFLPLAAPLTLLAVGKIKKSAGILNSAWALGQAALVGMLISGFYKAFTGRIPPPHVQSTLGALRKIFGTALPVSINTTTDVSREFRFGFMRGGVFWGWPSSHTTIAFAMAVTLFILYRKNKLIGYLALLYALYVGLGVSVSVHWFSEFIAGAIFGTAIGIVIGKSFTERYAALAK